MTRTWMARLAWWLRAELAKDKSALVVEGWEVDDVKMEEAA